MSSSARVFDLPLTIEAHEPLGASHHLLTLSTSNPARWDPGQFAMISLGQEAQAADPLLRRPFSIFNLPGSPAGVLQIFYKVLGRGTALLSRARPGETIRCLAPLGNGFAPRRAQGQRLLLVAGGIGSASLHPLGLQETASGGRPLMLYGCRTEAELAGARPTRDAGIEVRVATDDGSAGRRGFASDLLDDFLKEQGTSARNAWVVCACGPTAMMRATAAVAALHGVDCYASLESPMACGFGVCVGCVVGTTDLSEPAERRVVRYRRICVDGPVFDAARVIW